MRRTEYIYLQCKIRYVYMNFRQNFRQKKYSPFRKKTLAETVHYIPKGLRKGNPFHGPFAQLSYTRIYHNPYYLARDTTSHNLANHITTSQATWKHFSKWLDVDVIFNGTFCCITALRCVNGLCRTLWGLPPGKHAKRTSTAAKSWLSCKRYWHSDVDMSNRDHYEPTQTMHFFLEESIKITIEFALFDPPQNR